MPKQATEPAGRKQRAMSMAFPEHLAAYIDRQAEHLCCSRAAFLRRLVLEDMERAQDAGKAKTAA